MFHEEIEITDKNYQIKASLKIPKNKKSKTGIILAHGGIINRQSLLRKTYSFGEYLCDELGAYVIAPDFLFPTVHKHGERFSNYSEILTLSSNYLIETYNLENIMGFGHSLGSFILAKSVSANKYLDSIVTYGGPFKEFQGSRQNSFSDYLIKYLSSYGYSVNTRHLLKHIFDQETCRYLENVMLKDDEYRSDNYVFEFNSKMFQVIKELSDEYLILIKKWSKPALLLFGTQDGVTKKTLKYYPNGATEDNITINHIHDASHVTPCMNDKSQLSKLHPIITFFKQFNNIAEYPIAMEYHTHA